MSGICGLLNLDGAPATAEEIRAMVSMLKRRGPVAQDHWQSDSVALGHTLLATTPQCAYENQPVRHAASGCVITADVRLDNRRELQESLHQSENRKSTGDAELILHAYLKYGNDCSSYLLGDFAFAIWDPRKSQLFCARDHFGMRPLYYWHKPGHAFAFASEPRSILVLPKIPYDLNLGRIADFLVEELQWIDFTSTFYQGIYRLPPGHQVTVHPDSFQISEYWRPEPVTGHQYSNDDDYREAFVQVFTKAVASRLSTASGSVSSMLSGGMDSGSVVATAAGLLQTQSRSPLTTFSALTKLDSSRYPVQELKESQAILAAIEMPGIDPKLIYAEQVAADFETLVAGIDEPFDGDFMFMRAIFLAAKRHDETVMLDGAGGDVILGEGTYITRLLRSFRFSKAIREIAAEPHYRCYGSFLTSLLPYLRGALTPNILRRLVRAPSLSRRTSQALENTLLSPELAAEVDLRERFQRMQQTFNSGWKSDYFAERSNAIRYSMTAGRERYGRLAAGMGLECRDPYLDKRVVDFCSTLPGRFRLRDGWPKIILRDVMANKLPQEVLWCRGKPHIGWIFNTAFSKEASARGELNIDQLTRNLAPYVDSGALHDAWESYQSGTDNEKIHQAYMLSVWLREAAQRPAVS